MAMTDNTTALEALRDQANALPDAGSGGGGLETCMVYIWDDSFNGVSSSQINYTTIEGDVAAPMIYSGINNSIEVVKGSILSIEIEFSQQTGVSGSGSGVLGVGVTVGDDVCSVMSVKDSVATVYVGGDCDLSIYEE